MSLYHHLDLGTAGVLRRSSPASGRRVLLRKLTTRMIYVRMKHGLPPESARWPSISMVARALEAHGPPPGGPVLPPPSRAGGQRPGPPRPTQASQSDHHVRRPRP